MSEKRQRTSIVGQRQGGGLIYSAQVDVPEESTENLHEWRVKKVPVKGERILGDVIQFGVANSYQDARHNAIDALKEIEV